MKHLLSVEDLSIQQSLDLLDLANEMRKTNVKEIKRLPALSGKTVANLFFEDSTRTRLSFEIAAKRLSADVVSFAAKGSSVSKGESLKDTVITLEAMGVEALIVRHSASGVAKTIADSAWSNAAVINAGDGTSAKFDVIMMLRIQQERMNSAFLTGQLEYSELFGLTASRFELLPAKTLVMHPGPMNRGLEIASRVADSAQSLIKEQVTNGVALRMAVLYRLLAQEG